MRQESFTARMHCFVLSYADTIGFESSRPDDALAAWLSDELARAPREKPHAARVYCSSSSRATLAERRRFGSRRRATLRA
jgi:hypothetical protein